MDVCESEQSYSLPKHPTVETLRPILVRADKNNGTTHTPRTREVSSRYRSPSPTVSSGLRRCPSPSAPRTSIASTFSVPKRAISAERKRPSTPSSRPSTPSSRPATLSSRPSTPSSRPSTPSSRASRPATPPSPSSSTPVQDTSAGLMASRKIVGNKLPEGLWPSTMRSLSVSFQSDSFSLPISKREKPAPNALSDRTLRSSSNISAHKQGDTPPASRKPTPERKRSPLKGKNSVDQLENSRPVDGLNARLVDQHRWPSRAGGKLSSTALTRSIDLTDRNSRTSSIPFSGTGKPSVRRLSLEGANQPLQKSASDLLMLISAGESLRGGPGTRSLDANALERMSLSAVRTHSLPASGSRPSSPSKASMLSSSRGVSPSRMKAIPNPPSRGPSPSRVRPSSPSRQTNSTNSVLSYIVDIKKGKKSANHIDDAHQLRLLYNRHLQWGYMNARSQSVLHSQTVKAEQTLYNVWRTTSDMWDSVISKRLDLQQLRLKLKLHSVMNEQLAYLDQWALMERDHTSSLSLATEDLRACTLRLPITGGARGDIESVKSAVCSAVDVMQAMALSICTHLSRVEETNCLVAELADVAAQQRAMLDEGEALLASTAAMQVEEYSLRTHLLQLRQSLPKW